MHSILTEINEHLASTCLEKDRGHLDHEAFLIEIRRLLMCGLGQNQQAELPDLAFLCVNYSALYGIFV